MPDKHKDGHSYIAFWEKDEIKRKLQEAAERIGTTPSALLREMLRKHLDEFNNR